MTLEDITKEEKYPVGEVSSDRKSVSFHNRWWEQMALYHPHMFIWKPGDMKEGEIKLLISHLDNVITGDIYGENVSDDQKRNAKEVREELVRYL